MDKFIYFLILGILTYLNGSSNSLIQANKSGKNPFARIAVYFQEAKKGDSLCLMYFENPLLNEPSENGDYKEIESPLGKDGLFRFDFPVNGDAQYFFLAEKTRSKGKEGLSDNLRFIQLSKLYLAEPGDEVKILINKNENNQNPINSNLDQYNYSFEGQKGWVKYLLRYRIDSIMHFIEGHETPLFDKNLNYNDHNYIEYRIDTALRILENYKTVISPVAYNILKADIVSYKAAYYDYIYEWFYQREAIQGDAVLLGRFKQEYNKSLGKVSFYGIPVYALVKSKKYTLYAFSQAKINIWINLGQKNCVALYEYLKKTYGGTLLDQLLTYYFLNVSPTNKTDSLFNDAISIVKTDYCLRKIEELENRFKGSLAYNFSLPDPAGNIVHLSSLKGRVVFIDFWFTGCPACLNFYKNTLSKLEKSFQANKNVAFVSICIDKNKKSWLSSISSNKYTSNSVINLYTEGKASVHPAIKYYNIQQYPTDVIIGSDGRVYKFLTGNVYNQDLDSALIEAALSRKDKK